VLTWRQWYVQLDWQLTGLYLFPANKSKRKANRSNGRQSRGEFKQNAVGTGPLSTPQPGTFARQSILCANCSPFPAKYFATLTYAEVPITLTSGAAGVLSSATTFTLGSIFAPNAGGGHQPRYRDTLAEVYNYYLVHKVRVQVVFSDPSVDTMFCGCYAAGTDTINFGGQTLSLAQENPRTQLAFLSNTGSQTVTFDQAFNLWDLAGVTKTQYLSNTTQWASVMSSSPAQANNFLVAAGDFGGNAGSTIKCMVRLTFFVQFWDRVNIGQS